MRNGTNQDTDRGQSGWGRGLSSTTGLFFNLLYPTCLGASFPQGGMSGDLASLRPPPSSWSRPCAVIGPHQPVPDRRTSTAVHRGGKPPPPAVPAAVGGARPAGPHGSALQTLRPSGSAGRRPPPTPEPRPCRSCSRSPWQLATSPRRCPPGGGTPPWPSRRRRGRRSSDWAGRTGVKAAPL